MKTLHFLLIVILTASLTIFCNNVFADSIEPVSIDGHVTPKGCNAINGTVTYAKDIQNTTVQICNYNNKHFKLTEESLCFASMESESMCDLPVTCGGSFGTIGLMSQGDKISINEGSRQYIYTIYTVNLCVSEKYNEQERKITIIANDNSRNEVTNPNAYTWIDVVIPKGMLENITYTVDGKNPVTVGSINNNGLFADKNHTDIEIDLPLSFDTKKIEIMGNNKIPEFPFSMAVLMTAIIVTLAITRIKWNQISSFSK